MVMLGPMRDAVLVNICKSERVIKSDGKVSKKKQQHMRGKTEKQYVIQ